jgi:hypothetical protein
VRRLLLDALAVRDAHSDLLTRPADVIEGYAVELTADQPLPPAGRDDRDDRDDRNERDDRDEIVAGRQDRQAHLDSEIARLEHD